MKKKLTRSSFSALTETATLLDEREQRAVIGGNYWDDNGYWATDSSGNMHWTRTSQGDGYYYGDSGYYGSSGYYGDSGYYGGSGNYGGNGYYGYISYYSGSGSYPIQYEEPELMPYSQYISNQMSWENSRYSIYSEAASKYGIYLSNINIIVSSVERGANAWIGDNEVFLGDAFFSMSRSEQLRVLVHEYTHITEDQPWTMGVVKQVYTTLPEPPSQIKSYIMNVLCEGDEYSYQQHMYIGKVRDPQYYRNEVNAYMKEKQLFTDFTYDEIAKLEYRIWYFSELVNLAERPY